MVQLTINGRTVSAEDGETLLTVARREGFVVPTLCHHEVLGSSGRCRFCVVEVHEGERKRIIASCLAPAKEGMEVFTGSEEVKQARRSVLEALLLRCPTAEVIQRLASQYGITPPSEPQETEFGKCILCTLCIRCCKDIVGVNALGLTGKGPTQKVGPRTDDPAAACIGCGACVVICPTGHIVMKEEDGVRTVWNKRFELATCPRCGRRHAPLFQLQWIAGRTGVSLDELMVCQDCK